MKQCNVCQINKSLKEYYVDSKVVNGKRYSYPRGTCKKCWGERVKLWASTHRGQRNESQQRYIENHKERYLNFQRVGQKKFNQFHPNRSTVYNLTHKLAKKKDACEKCGSNEKLHLHHLDYSKPLDVLTLCIPCHEGAHHA